MTGKQLRNSILQWAIQGKLVPQDPNDEPASVLLERIREEKARLVKEKKIKKDKNESIIYRGEDNSYYEKILASGEVRCIDDEIPFEIPDSWVWCRLEQISSYIQRGKSPKYSMIKEIPVIAQKCNQWSGFQIEKAQFIEPASLKGYNNERLLRNGDLMWNSTGLGTLGRIAIYWDNLNPYGIAVADSHVTVIRPFDKEIQSNYLYAYFSSPTVQLVIEEKADGSTKQKELSTSTVKSYLIPLPPKDEQVRIIDKIRQLNPIIEKYGKLYDSLELLNKNLNIELKKSILQEAIQGKLVPQRTTEGTAEELFEKINAEKIRLVKEGRLKASALKGERRIFKGDDNKYYENKNGNIVCIDEIIPFDIPPTWQWSRVGSILNIWSARRVHEKDWRSKGIPFYRAREIGKLSDTGIVNNDLFIDRVLYDELSKSGVPQIGDLMMTAVGTLGKTYIIKSNFPFYFKDGSVLCISNLYHLNPAYLRLFFDSNAFKNQYISESDGTTVATLTMVRMNKYLIPIPPLKEQARIVTKYNNLTSIMSR